MLTYIIDEDNVSLYIAEQVLQMEGVTEVISFTSAEQALAYLLPRLATEVPRIILLDLNMPVMDGWAFLEALEPYHAELQEKCQVYLLTSSLAQIDSSRAKGYELVSGIIHKPLDETEVRSMRARVNS